MNFSPYSFDPTKFQKCPEKNTKREVFGGGVKKEEGSRAFFVLKIPACCSKTGAECIQRDFRNGHPSWTKGPKRNSSIFSLLMIISLISGLHEPTGGPSVYSSKLGNV